MATVRVIGPGRAGMSLALALEGAGWPVLGIIRRHEPVAEAARGVDLLVVATADREVADVAGAVRPVATTVVAHLAGSLGPEALAGHVRRAAVHPLVTLPEPEIGAARLAGGAFFAVAGDPLGESMVEALGGRVIKVADRASYHAAACIASNHLVALLGQAQRVAAAAGVALEPLLGLAAGALEDVSRLGPQGALTGPAARNDEATLRRHRAVLPAPELAAYDALAEQARRLAEGRQPAGEVSRCR